MGEQQKRNGQLPAINPLMVQSYFDGELRSDELEALPHDALSETETWQALDELRRVVRTDYELACEPIDGYAMLDEILKKIDAEPKSEPLCAPQRRPLRARLIRWIPAMAGAALFLLSIPGLAGYFVNGNGNRHDTEPKTVVYINDSAAQAQFASQSETKARRAWLDDGAAQPHTVALPRPADNQLTIQELDFALRKLVERIETLEEANRKNIETGRTALDTGDAEGVHKM